MEVISVAVCLNLKWEEEGGRGRKSSKRRERKAKQGKQRLESM